MTLIQNKKKVLEDALNEALESGNQDSKSSAGDKHETAKAMAQLEQEKLSNQLQELNTQIVFFQKLEHSPVSEIVKSGSLVKTNQGIFYIATGLGKVEMDLETYFVISAQSPIGMQMMNKKVNEQFVLNQKEYIINEIK